MRLKDKTAIISGATRGIGRAIALELAKEGANIGFNYLKSDDLAEKLVKEIENLNSQSMAFKIDCTDTSRCKEFVEQIKARFGRLDILVNNAGIIKDKAFMLMEKSDWDEVINVNLNGLYNLTHACIVSFMKQKSGCIINLTSIAGLDGRSRQTNYAASKAGIIGFTKSLAKEIAGFNVRVNAVAPGFIETDMTKDLKDREKLIQDIPLKRFGRTEEVAKLVCFLASDQANYITGQVIRIDGGIG